MGKVIKNPNPRAVDPSNQAPVIPPRESTPIPIKTESVENTANILQARVVAVEKFDSFLAQAEQAIKENKLNTALQHLLNLEITDFENFRVHELLADVYLLLGNLDLAKEQCIICANLMKIDKNDNLFSLKNFDELLSQAGNKKDAEKKFNEMMQKKLSQDDLFESTKTAFDLAAHYMAVHEYKKAETLLIAFRDRYIECLEENKD
ncbi:hypothetical protein SAMN02745150_00550 [Brevinema andersonii]|uniref:Tetratricopeptide repeat-containing protein n=1 Tax=Brevinema andersonii TaxID=34097 RepID=A0A1I1DHS4_BREAD|nr:hypothetical protein [Brevinema andersonii]SFB74471.1 hypothetical protein SAMN02745150_00550 [Brevinema andersonii]